MYFFRRLEWNFVFNSSLIATCSCIALGLLLVADYLLMHFNKLFFAIIALSLAGCDTRFRLKPKKGRPHPHSEEKFERDWVYKHPKATGRATPLTDEEIAFRDQQAEIRRVNEETYSTALEMFEQFFPNGSLDSTRFDEQEFAGFLALWFQLSVSRTEYQINSTSQTNTALSARTEQYISGCAATPGTMKPSLVHHLHYGDDPNDTETYYSATNGLFSMEHTDSVCRVFQIDIVRFGVGKDKVKILALFFDEQPLTDTAWTEEIVDDIQPDLSDIHKSARTHPEDLKALFNFISSNLYDPIAIRYKQILVNPGADQQVKIQVGEQRIVMVGKMPLQKLKISRKKNEL